MELWGLNEVASSPSVPLLIVVSNSYFFIFLFFFTRILALMYMHILYLCRVLCEHVVWCYVQLYRNMFFQLFPNYWAIWIIKRFCPIHPFTTYTSSYFFFFFFPSPRQHEPIPFGGMESREETMRSRTICMAFGMSLQKFSLHFFTHFFIFSLPFFTYS